MPGAQGSWGWDGGEWWEWWGDDLAPSGGGGGDEPGDGGDGPGNDGWGDDPGDDGGDDGWPDDPPEEPPGGDGDDPGDGGDGGAGGWGGEGDDPGDTSPPEEERVPVYIYEWVTQGDGRVCPVCGPLDGSRWEDDDGPFPPLHVGCRCQRVLVGVEWRTAWREAALWGRVAGDWGARLWPR